MSKSISENMPPGAAQVNGGARTQLSFLFGIRPPMPQIESLFHP